MNSKNYGPTGQIVVVKTGSGVVSESFHSFLDTQSYSY